MQLMIPLRRPKICVFLQITLIGGIFYAKIKNEQHARPKSIEIRRNSYIEIVNRK